MRSYLLGRALLAVPTSSSGEKLSLRQHETRDSPHPYARDRDRDRDSLVEVVLAEGALNFLAASRRRGE